MATNYNPRSDSSASRNRKKTQVRRGASETGRQQSARPLPSPNRSKVAYIQSAKNDLAAQTQAKDPRARYARFRSDNTVRVLGDAQDARSRERHQVGDTSATSGFSSRGGEGVRNSRRVRRSGRDARGMTVREHRAQQRRTTRRTSKAFGRVLTIVITLLVLAVAAFLVYQSPAFSVREVNVEGAQRLSGARLTELAAVPGSSTLLRLDVEGIQSRVEADPWVESASVKRSFPATVVLTVVERQMAAVVEVPAARSGESNLNWLISRDGRWLGSFAPLEATAPADEGEEGDEDGENTEGEETSADADENTTNESSQGGEEQPPAGEQETSSSSSGASILEGVQVSASEAEQLPFIKEVSHSIAPLVGEPITDEGVLNALNALNGLSPEMLALIQSISAPDKVRTMIMLTNNVGVAFGAAEDIAVKERVILQLLAEHEGAITYINVRVADRATYRGIT